MTSDDDINPTGDTQHTETQSEKIRRLFPDLVSSIKDSQEVRDELIDELSTSQEHNRICRICGNMLEHRQMYYCSRRCSQIDAYRIRKGSIKGFNHVIRKCEVCGILHKVERKALSGGRGRSCNKQSCMNTIRSPTTKLHTVYNVCKVCKVKFPTLIKEDEYCSESCNYVWNFLKRFNKLDTLKDIHDIIDTEEKERDTYVKLR